MSPSIRKLSTKRANSRRYNEKDFQAAYLAISEGRLSLSRAAKDFNIPKSTLHERLSNSQLEKPSRGSCTVLTKEEERKLADWVIRSARSGFLNLREQTISLEAKSLLQKSGRNNVKCEFSRRWYTGFCKRHVRVQHAISQQCHHNSSKSNYSQPHHLQAWFERIKQHLKDALGETFAANRMLHCLQSSAETASVLLSCSAAGQVLQPLLVLPSNGKHVEQRLPAGWSQRIQWKTCSIDQQVLFHYLTQVLYKQLKQQNFIFPLIVCLEQLRQPLPLYFIEECSKLGLVLINLYHVALHQLRLDFQQRLQLQSFETLVPSLQNAILQQLSARRIRQDFFDAGIYPLNYKNICPLPSCAASEDLDSYSSDYSNSLGSVAQNDASSSVENENQLGFQQFKQILGSAMLIDLEEYEMLPDKERQQQNYSKEFVCLLQIYQVFKQAKNQTAAHEIANSDYVDSLDTSQQLEKLLKD